MEDAKGAEEGTTGGVRGAIAAEGAK